MRLLLAPAPIPCPRALEPGPCGPRRYPREVLRDLLRPAAIVSHLLVLTVVVACVALGQWQVDRLQFVREQNARAVQRMAEPPVDLAALMDPAASDAVDDAALEFRRVEVTGTYRPDEEVLQRNRQYRNQTGFHVLTPLELPNGAVVLVRRGWVPASLDQPPVAQAAPPPGDVTVIGLLERPVPQPSFGPQDPDEGRLERVFHTDTTRLDRQVTGELFPMILRIDAELDNPTEDQLPFPAGPPELDEGSHLSYAVQWHIFAVLALVTYVAWWWRRLARSDGDGPDGGGSGGGGTPGADADAAAGPGPDPDTAAMVRPARP
jgi:surfeit locus 1 family protein